MSRDNRLRWDAKRTARAVYLFSLGWTYTKIAADPFIRSDPEAVRKRLARCDLGLDKKPSPREFIRVPEATRKVFEEAGSQWQMTPEEAMAAFLYQSVQRESPIYIANLIDGDRAPT